jgi:predicted Zn-dependent protease
LARAKRGADAIEAMSRAIRLRPKDVRSYRALSEVHWMLGNSKAALMATKEAIELAGSQKDPGTAKQLAELQAQQRTLQNEVIRQRFSRIRRPFWRKKG